MARPKGTFNIETPEKMWALFLAYKKEVKENPILKHDFVGGVGKSVQRKIERPLTFEGFSNYCFNEITKNVDDYFCNKNESYTNFSAICSHIKKIIRQDQIEGGMAGIYNPSITQRLNGLKEQVEQTNIEQPLFPEK